MNRKPTRKELERLASGRGVEDLPVTCSADSGHGPCGTYLQWLEGKCSEGHPIEIEVKEPIKVCVFCMHEVHGHACGFCDEYKGVVDGWECPECGEACCNEYPCGC